MEKQADVTVFAYQGQTVRTVTGTDGEPWWVAKDVCDVLGLSDTNKALLPLEEDEKLTRILFGSGQRRKVWLINESGLYTLILRSNKPQAKPFRRWVTHEVLPAIRRTGGYRMEGRQVPEDIVPVSRQFREAVRLARDAGMDKKQAVFSANQLTEALTGYDCLALLGVPRPEQGPGQVPAFFREQVLLGAEYVESSQALYEAYLKWAQANGQRRMSQIRFNREIAATFPMVQKGRNSRTRRFEFRGLRLAVREVTA